MTITQIVSEIAKREGQKREVPIGDIREIMAILADMISEDPKVLTALEKYASKRLSNGGKKKNAKSSKAKTA